MRILLYYLFVFVFVSMLASCNNQNAGAQKQDSSTIENGIALLAFEEMKHDFGTVIEGEKVVYAFRFTNHGNADLKLTSVGTSCGCTASDYPLEPIKPGKTGKIKITFDSSNRRGMQHKKITIRSNTNPEFTVLNVYAQVVDKRIRN